MFKLWRHLGRNKDNGRDDAFYQVYALCGPKYSVLVKHYGKYSPGVKLTPAGHGRAEVELFGLPNKAEREMRTLANNKSKRGYVFDSVELQDFNTTQALSDFVNVVMPKADRASILMHLLEGTNQLDGAEVKEEPRKPEPAAKPKVIERDERWGSWS